MPVQSEVQSNSSPTKVCPKCYPSLSSYAGAVQRIPKEPFFTRKKKVPERDRKVTFLTYCAEFGSSTLEDNMAMRFKAGYRRVNSGHPTTYQMNYTGHPLPMGTTPIISAAECKLNDDQQGGNIPHEDPRDKKPAKKLVSKKQPSVEPLNLPLSTNGSDADIDASCDHPPTREPPVKANDKTVKPPKIAPNKAHRPKPSSKSPAKDSTEKKKKKKKRLYPSPLKRLCESDYRKHKLAKAVFETQYREHYKNWLGLSWAAVEKEKSSPDNFDSRPSLTDASDPRQLKHSPQLTLPHHHPPLLHWKTQYETHFVQPAKFIYDKGVWKSNEGESTNGEARNLRENGHDNERSESWFDQLVELRQKAEHYKWKSQRTSYDPHYDLLLDPDKKDPIEEEETASTSYAPCSSSQAVNDPPHLEEAHRHNITNKYLHQSRGLQAGAKHPSPARAGGGTMVVEDVESDESESIANPASQMARTENDIPLKITKGTSNPPHAMMTRGSTSTGPPPQSGTRYTAAHPPPQSGTRYTAAHPPPQSGTRYTAAHPPPQSGTRYTAAHPPPQSGTRYTAAHPPPQSGTRYTAAHPPPQSGTAPQNDVMCTCNGEASRILVPALDPNEARLCRHHLDLTTPSTEGILIYHVSEEPLGNHQPQPSEEPLGKRQPREEPLGNHQPQPSEEPLGNHRSSGNHQSSEKPLDNHQSSEEPLSNHHLARMTPASSSPYHAHCVPKRHGDDERGDQRVTHHIRKLNFDGNSHAKSTKATRPSYVSSKSPSKPIVHYTKPLGHSSKSSGYSSKPSGYSSKPMAPSSKLVGHLNPTSNVNSSSCHTCGATLRPAHSPPRRPPGISSNTKMRATAPAPLLVVQQPRRELTSDSLQMESCLQMESRSQLEEIRQNLVQDSQSQNSKRPHVYSYSRPTDCGTTSSFPYSGSKLSMPSTSTSAPYQARDVDELSLSSMSLSSCSVASDILEKAKKRRNHFWTEHYQPNE